MAAPYAEMKRAVETKRGPATGSERAKMCGRRVSKREKKEEKKPDDLSASFPCFVGLIPPFDPGRCEAPSYAS